MNYRLLYEFVRSVIIEGKIDDLKTKNPTLSSEIDQLSSSIKLKYMSWAVNQLKLNSSVKELSSAIESFDQNIQRVKNADINAYKTLSDLKDHLSSLGSSTTSTKHNVKSSGAEKIFSDDTHILMFIRTKSASVCYGAGTKWCISAKGLENRWKDYTDDNSVFYFLINKQLPSSDVLYKVAIAITRDPDDNQAILKVDEYSANDKKLKSIPDYMQKYIDMAIADSLKRESLSELILFRQNKVTSKEKAVNSIRQTHPAKRGALFFYLHRKEWLAEFINDDDPNLRWMTSMYIPVSYLPQMMKDKSYSVRLEVVKRIEPKYLVHMLNDEHEIINHLAKERLSSL